MIIQLVHRFVRRRYHELGLVSKRLELNSCSLHYYESSPSSKLPTLVLVHGLGTSSSTWIHLMPFFVGRFHVLAIDLPGFGFSFLTRGHKFLSFSEHSDVLTDWINRFAGERFTLLGHSLGGWLAARYAVRNQKKIKRLILINTSGILYDGAEQQKKMFDVRTSQDVRKLVDRLWFRYPWYFKLFIPAIKNDMKRRAVAEFVGTIRGDDFLNSELDGFTMPVTLIWGEQDGLISSRTVEVLTKALRHIEVHRIDRCGHVPQLERPDELKAILRTPFNEE